MLKLLKTLAAMAGIAAAGAAHAAVITYDAGLDANGVPITTLAGTTLIDFNDGSCGYASCSGNFAVVQGDLSGVYAAPYVAGTDSDDTTKYLTVPQNLQPTTSARFDLGTTANYFGLFWGSIDSYNTIEFWLGSALVASFTGSDVISPPNAANGNQTAGPTNTYVNFFDLPTFDSLVLTSTQYAFESDNHAYGMIGVSAPGTVALLCAGLLAIAVVRRRQVAASVVRRSRGRPDRLTDR